MGVASRDDLLEPPPTGLDTAVVVRLVATVCFLPLGSVRVSVSAPLLAASRLSSAFLVAMAVWALVPKAAVVSPRSIPLRDVLVRLSAGEREGEEVTLVT